MKTEAEGAPAVRGMSERTRSAYIWWCGDQECDCTQPIVEDKWRNSDGYWQFDRIWEGTFMTAGDGDRSAQMQELRRAAKEYGAILHEGTAPQAPPDPF